MERTTRERREILEALERRDAERAAALMAAHIEDVKRTVIEQLAAHGSSDQDSQ